MKFPSTSLRAMIPASLFGDTPRTLISPTNASMIFPSLLTRTLCVSSGVSKTVISS